MKSSRFADMASCLFAGIVLWCVPTAHGDLFDQYQLTSSFELPGPGTLVEWRVDVLNDGRIFVVRSPRFGADVELYVETTVCSRVFDLAGVLPFGAGNLTFLRVRPDGTTFAVGDFSQVAVCEIDTLACTVFDAAHYDGEWYDDRYLALTQSLGVGASILDTMSPNPGDPINPLIVQGVPGSPAGITFDANGNLFVGTWDFDLGGPIRVFDNASWVAAWNSGSPLDFEADGTLIVVDVLSAVSLGFDSEGNLHIGGSSWTDPSLAALVSASAVADAIAGLGPADPEDPSQVRRFPPECFHLPWCNVVTQELYIRCYGEWTVEVYGAREPVPTVSEWGLTVMVLLVMAVGTLVFRRRRRASTG